MKRKDFLKITAPALLLLTNGQWIKAESSYSKKKRLLRFAVASDGHYGQEGTDYENHFTRFVNAVNEAHQKDPFAFCMINGDIIHDDVRLFPAAKAALDQLIPKYYVTQGNHDHASPELWENIWKMPLNYDFEVAGTGFIAATTSNEKGEYTCPDLEWIDRRLEYYRQHERVFIFTHINPAKLTDNGIHCPELLRLLSGYKNVKAVFNGHDHYQDDIKRAQNIPFIFDGHFGSNWGTDYRGFRVVEVMKDNVVITYIMDPFKKINSNKM